MLSTEDFDRNDRDRLVSQNTLISIYLTGDIRVLHHVGQTEILYSGGWSWGQCLVERIEQRVQNCRWRCVGIARMHINIEISVERPHGRRPQCLYHGLPAFFGHKQRWLFNWGNI